MGGSATNGAAGGASRIAAGLCLLFLLCLEPAWSQSAPSGHTAAKTSAAAPQTPGSGAASSSAPPSPKTLDIWEIDIDGNTLLDELTLDQAVEPFLGPTRSTDEIDHARAALENVYHERGFKTVFVSIPRQMVHQGIVHLKVTEAPVGHLRVVNSKYHSIEEIKAMAPSLAEGHVPDFNQVQNDIVALNRSPDQRVTPLLRAGTAPGTVDVDLVVDDHLPVHATVEVNNEKSQNTSELRTVGTLSYDNLWQRGHSLTLSYQTAPERPSDARVYYAGYLAPFGASPFSLLITGIKSDSNVATVGGTDVIGRGQILGFRGILSLPGTDHFTQNLSFGMDYKHFRNVTSLTSSSFETPVTYFPFTLSYSAIKRLSSGVLEGDFSVTFASPRLGSTNTELDFNRLGASGQDLYFRDNITWTQDLPYSLQSFLRVTEQLTDQPLITNEEFPVGGMSSVRGYLEAETLGDLGLSATAELRAPPLEAWHHEHRPAAVQDLVFALFTDVSNVRQLDPAAGQQSSFQLFSVGTGATVKFFSFLNGAAYWAEPLRSGPTTRSWASRFLFRVWGNF